MFKINTSLLNISPSRINALTPPLQGILAPISTSGLGIKPSIAAPIIARWYEQPSVEYPLLSATSKNFLDIPVPASIAPKNSTNMPETFIELRISNGTKTVVQPIDQSSLKIRDPTLPISYMNFLRAVTF